MLKVIVLLKQVLDPSGIVVQPEEKRILVKQEKYIIDRSSKAALDIALWLKERENIEVTALSLGLIQARKALREALRHGCDFAYLLCDNSFQTVDAASAAFLLASGIIKLGGADLIIAGQESSDTGSGQVGPRLAELLNYSQVTNAHALSIHDGNLRAIRRWGERYFTVHAPLPAVITVARDSHPVSRPHLHRGRNAQHQNKVVLWNAVELGVKRDDLTPLLKYRGKSFPSPFPKRLVYRDFSIQVAGEVVTTLRRCKVILGDDVHQQIIDGADIPKVDRQELGFEIKHRTLPMEEMPHWVNANGGKKRAYNIWVVAELLNGEIARATLEVIAEAQRLSGKAGGRVAALILDETCEFVSNELFETGVDQVILAYDPLYPDILSQYQPNIFAQALANLATRFCPDVILLPATDLGNDLAPRLAQRLQAGLLSHCVKVEIEPSENIVVGTCPILSGQVYHSFSCLTARPQIATLQPGYFPISQEYHFQAGVVERVRVNLSEPVTQLTWTSLRAVPTQQPESVADSHIVVSVGRKSTDIKGYILAEQLAFRMGGEFLDPRELWRPIGKMNQRLLKGKMQKLAPDLFLACGRSGKIRDYPGIRESRLVFAIHPDENSSIIKIANLAIVSEAGHVIPELLQALAN